MPDAPLCCKIIVIIPTWKTMLQTLANRFKFYKYYKNMYFCVRMKNNVWWLQTLNLDMGSILEFFSKKEESFGKEKFL